MLPAIFVLLPLPEAKYDVFVSGKKIGVASYAATDRKAGGRVTRLRMSFLGQSTDETTETDARGAVVRSRRLMRRGKTTSQEVVIYGLKGEATITLDNGKPRKVAAPKGSRNDPSELWFRSVKPQPGTWAVFQSLDVGRGTWEAVRVTYVGKKGKGNLVRQVRKGATMEFSLDDRGMPLAIESSSFKMVRR